MGVGIDDVIDVVANEGVAKEGMVANAGADIRGVDEGISSLVVKDLGVPDVGEGAKEVNVEEEVILKRAIDNGK
nr:hypothetical protein [Tanacetum cinerariifolium]